MLFRSVLAPDFSTYTDMPRAMQIYNHYRKHWVARYLTDSGITVIPTISRSTPDSYEWCFEGEPRNSVVAISTVGCMRRDARELFLMGFDEMKRRLCPTKNNMLRRRNRGECHLQGLYKYSALLQENQGEVQWE